MAYIRVRTYIYIMYMCIYIYMYYAYLTITIIIRYPQTCASELVFKEYFCNLRACEVFQTQQWHKIPSYSYLFCDYLSTQRAYLIIRSLFHPY